MESGHEEFRITQRSPVRRDWRLRHQEIGIIPAVLVFFAIAYMIMFGGRP